MGGVYKALRYLTHHKPHFLPPTSKLTSSFLHKSVEFFRDKGRFSAFREAGVSPSRRLTNMTYHRRSETNEFSLFQFKFSYLRREV